jgi:hypothetical protein
MIAVYFGNMNTIDYIWRRVNMTELEDCKGCIGTLHGCLYIKGVEKFKCPCVICLVKVMCEPICDDFVEFAHRYEEGEKNETL